MALRRADGFQRFVASIQYHGASFLGVTKQKYEDCIHPLDGADLRGYLTVESRIAKALDQIFYSQEHWEHFQISSRTDRGVHAWKNTFHIDIRDPNATTDPTNTLRKLFKGVNQQLARQTTRWSQELQTTWTDAGNRPRNRKRNRHYHPAHACFEMFQQDDWKRHSISEELRILNVKMAPPFMENPFYDNFDQEQPEQVDWNARFSATRRTYAYRILAFRDEEHAMMMEEGGTDSEWAIPFEWDRSLRIRTKHGRSLDVPAMQQAARYLEGTHDFTSFRGANCQRQSPIVTMESIQVHAQPYGMWGLEHLMMEGKQLVPTPSKDPLLVTIVIAGNAFLYRQVRNMVGCLIEVGKRKIQPIDVVGILEAQDRRVAPSMVPPHGLFLANVEHGDFQI